MLCVLFIFIISPSTSLPRVARFVYFDGALGSHRTRNEMSISCRVFQLKFNAKNQQHQVFNQLFWNAFSCGNEKSMFSCFRWFFVQTKKNSPIISIDWNMNLKGHTQTGRSNQWQTKRKKKQFIIFFQHFYRSFFSSLLIVWFGCLSCFFYCFVLCLLSISHKLLWPVSLSFSHFTYRLLLYCALCHGILTTSSSSIVTIF